MKKDVIDQIIEVRMKRNALRQKLEELRILRRKIYEEVEQTSQQIFDLEDEEKELMEKFRKEHTKEFYQPMDEIDICRRIKTDGSIKALKF